MKFGMKIVGAAAVALGVGTFGASAATLMETISGNDCVGEWDGGTASGFAGCESPAAYGSSPIIAKFDAGGAVELNTSIFGSIDGAEFTVDISGDTVDWSYIAGLLDPIITVIAVKSGPEFDVWYDAGAAIASGVFSTASGKDISHVSFYDSDGGDPPVGFEVPLPAGMPLILVGLGAFGALRLRSRKKA